MDSSYNHDNGDNCDPHEPTPIVPVVTDQPGTITYAPPPPNVIPGDDGGPVSIRNMTTADSKFSARVLVEAFRSKFEHAVGRRNIDAVTVLQAKELINSPNIYDRNFVAFYEGVPAGHLGLKTKGDPSYNSSSWRDACSALGCCGACGFMCLGWTSNIDDHDIGVCYIDHICVDANFRGKGIGKVLMERAEYEARIMGCTRMSLLVAKDNRAKHLYERQGYVVTKEEDGCLCSYCPTGIRMWYKMEKPLT
ncbi:uncharacterized protein LOC144432971 [Glandiceps talaboti]